MTPEAFVASLQAQCRVVPWVHAINPPADQVELQAWTRAYSGHVLPADLLRLYGCANGFSLHRIRYAAEIVGEAFVVPSLRAVQPILQAMYGRHARPLQAAPSRWFSVGRHTDGSFFVALDPRDSTYRTIAPIVPGEAEVIARSCSEYLVWLSQFLLPPSELSSLAAGSAA